MTITNTSKKIINIGTTVLMPDQSMPASEAVCNTPAIKAFAKKGMLTITKDAKAAGKPAAPKAPETPKAPEAPKNPETPKAAAPAADTQK